MTECRELDLRERTSNLLRSETRSAAQAAGLQPILLDVLSYLARCNRYRDTPVGVTEDPGLIQGTLSHEHEHERREAS